MGEFGAGGMPRVSGVVITRSKNKLLQPRLRAAKIPRTLIPRTQTPQTPIRTVKSLLNTSSYLIFWLWNLMFLGWAYLLLLPLLAGPLIVATIDGAIPLGFSLSLVGLLAIPTGASVVGATARFRKWPGLLMRFFYGVELPLFGFCLLRMFIIRELNPVSAGFLLVLLLGITSFALEVGFGYGASRRAVASAQLVSQSVVLMLGLYGGTLLLLYVIPSLCGLGYWILRSIPEFFSFRWLGSFLWDLVRYPASVLGLAMGLALFIFSASLFFASPFAFCHLYVRSWWRIASAYGKQWGQRGAVGLTAAVAIGLLLAFHASTQLPQPQAQAFALLGLDPQNLETIAVENGAEPGGMASGGDRGGGDLDGSTPGDLEGTTTESFDLKGDRAAILANLPQIRQGLLNAHLHRYRYLSANHNVDALTNFYESTTVLRPSIISALQSFHNYLISPFLYQGFDWEKELAPKLYAQIFDTPIQRGEREAIQAALQATWNREEAKAGLININQQVIPLTRQAVTVTEYGDWGQVEIQERYENPTGQDEEIFYSFSLPETAVITGLWLGDDDNPQRYPAVVATRGAAQEVYNQEVQRQVDPALLEQVGPRQYRLRVFPIPAQGEAGQLGHAQIVLRYQVLRTEAGWSLPQLTERRNVYWNRQTQRERQGEILKQHDWDADWGWFEASIPAQSPSSPQTHQLQLQDYGITATPLQPQEQGSLPQRLAVVLDSSYSMTAVLTPLVDNLAKIQEKLPQTQIDYYLTAAPGADPQRLDRPTAETIRQFPFFGSLSLAQMLHQFETLQRGANSADYDGILLLTDAGSYELEADIAALQTPAAPLWLVHLGPSLPIAYEDAVLTAIEASRGGVTTDAETALQRLSLERLAGPETRIADGYRWQVRSVAPAPPVPSAAPPTGPAPAAIAAAPVPPTTDRPDPFAPLAARQLILYRSRTTDMTELANLDAVNALAKDYHLISPYSSMIALVNDRQRENLAAAEQRDDRFDREVEDGSENLTEPSSVMATPVPETGMVVGIVLASGLLLGALRRRYPANLRY